jgi:hypothetical protein
LYFASVIKSLLLMHNPLHQRLQLGTEQAGQFQCALPILSHPSVYISGTGLVTANSGTYTFTQTNAAGCTSAVSSSIVLLMHNPLHQQLQQEQLRSQHVQQQQAVSRSQVTVHHTYTFTKCVSISGTGLVTANSGTYALTQTECRMISPLSSDIVVNAQPATPSAPISGTVTQPTC